MLAGTKGGRRLSLGFTGKAAFDAYANLFDGTRTQVQQRPHLAVVCTAGLVAEHEMAVDYASTSTTSTTSTHSTASPSTRPWSGCGRPRSCSARTCGLR